MYTETRLTTLGKDAKKDEFYISGVLQNDHEHDKMSAILDRFRQNKSGPLCHNLTMLFGMVRISQYFKVLISFFQESLHFFLFQYLFVIQSFRLPILRYNLLTASIASSERSHSSADKVICQQYGLPFI